MAIPDYQSLMLPLLKRTADGADHAVTDLVESLAEEFHLTDAEQRMFLPSGRNFVFDNRIRWAQTYLKKAGLLSAPKRGVVQITQRGLKVLAEHPERVNIKVLSTFPEFRDFRAKQPGDKAETEGGNGEQLDPQESIEFGYHQIRKQLSTELLARIKGCSPKFFEKLVVDLLLAMGYGGSRRDFGDIIGKSGDGGLDGRIKEDKLGLDVVYIQAKRWDKGQVARKDIQAFVGALHGKKARKGVFITTSGFAETARDYVRDIQDTVVLIDGDELADLMIENGVGVSNDKTYEIKKIDSDYFVEE